MIRSRRIEVVRVGSVYRAETTDWAGSYRAQGPTAEEALVELAEQLLDALVDSWDESKLMGRLAERYAGGEKQ